MKRQIAWFIIFLVARVTLAQNPGFPGVEKAMDAETYEMAGLSKLTDQERSVLDKFIREYAATRQKDAATTAAAEAVNRALKENKVRPPEIEESKMQGTFKGYGLRTIFALENGEIWKPAVEDTVSYPPVENPKVVIYRDTFGYKMFVEGAGTIRVRRVK